MCPFLKQSIILPHRWSPHCFWLGRPQKGFWACSWTTLALWPHIRPAVQPTTRHLVILVIKRPLWGLVFLCVWGMQMSVWMYMCGMFVCVHTCMTHACGYVCVHVHTCKCASVWVYVHTCFHVCIQPHTCIFKYIFKTLQENRILIWVYSIVGYWAGYLYVTLTQSSNGS